MESRCNSGWNDPSSLVHVRKPSHAVKSFLHRGLNFLFCSNLTQSSNSVQISAPILTPSSSVIGSLNDLHYLPLLGASPKFGSTFDVRFIQSNSRVRTRRTLSLHNQQTNSLHLLS